jgi:thymidylate synthase (FAD)
MRIIEPSSIYLDTADLSPYQFMEKAGRTCYKSEANITDESAVKFVRGLKKSGHTAMLEHSHIILSVSNDIAVPFIESIKNSDFDVDGTKVRIGNYLNITECGPVFVISGSFRAFFALYDERFSANKTSNAVKLVMKKLNEAFPDLFDDVDIKLVDGKIFVMDRETFIKFATATFTPDAEKANVCISRHLTHTCKFVCDRGVTHEFVRHRPASFAQESTRYCNYSKDQFGNEITVIRPSEFVEGTEEHNAWKDACEKAEYDYFKLLKLGVKPQLARDVLPTSIKTEIIITATEEEWQHIINLRKHCTTGSAHPQIIQSMNMVYDTLLEKSNNRLS